MTTDFAERPVLALLQAAAALNPAAIAVVDGQARATYAALLSMVEHAAGRIAAMVPEGAAVAVVVPDTIPGLAITIGCLVAGRICISLDPEQPADRLAATLREVAPAATIMPTDMASVLTGQTAALPARDSDPISNGPGVSASYPTRSAAFSRMMADFAFGVW